MSDSMMPPPVSSSSFRSPIIPPPLTNTYTPPYWSAIPKYKYGLEVLKNGLIAEELDLHTKPYCVLGRHPSCDIIAEHQSISRQHAVIQFRDTGEAYVYDCGSTHGTIVNKKPVLPNQHVEIHVGDVIRLGQSTRFYVLTGPDELRPPERDMIYLPAVQNNPELAAKLAAARQRKPAVSMEGVDEEADGISWGMKEDAVEEDEEVEEDVIDLKKLIASKPLTDRQRELVDRWDKRQEKMRNLQHEIEVLEGKEISQGTLTDGQRNQIERNHQRIKDLTEQCESLELTIREALEDADRRTTGISAKTKGRKRGGSDSEDSEEDDFYDRTKKNKKAKGTKAAQEQVKTPAIIVTEEGAAKEIDIHDECEKKRLLGEIDTNNAELARLEQSLKRLVQANIKKDEEDALDSFMSNVEATMKGDQQAHLQKQIDELRSRTNALEESVGYIDRMRNLEQMRVVKPHIQTLPQNVLAPGTKGPSIPVEANASVVGVAGFLKRAQQVVKDHEEKQRQERENLLQQKTDEEQKLLSEPSILKPLTPAFVDDYKEQLMQKTIDRAKLEEAERMNAMLGGQTRGGLVVRKKAKTPSGDAPTFEAAATQPQASVADDSFAYDSIGGGGGGADDDKADDGNSDWVPPSNQTGDGKTSLNAKFGY